MMFMHASGGGVGTPMPEWTAVSALLPVPRQALSTFTKSARSQNVQAPRSGSGMYGLGQDTGITSGLTILGVLGLIGVGLWAFSGKKHHRRH